MQKNRLGNFPTRFIIEPFFVEKYPVMSFFKMMLVSSINNLPLTR